MKVVLLSNTPDPECLIATAARLCYSNKADIESISDGFTKDEIKTFIEQLLESGHLSPFEHVTFTFGIEGISRVVSHELVRHRIGVAISQRSQRYCFEKECKFVKPVGYNKNVHTEELFDNSLEYSKHYYQHLIESGIDKQIARYVLPNATETRMIVTMNARELRHFFNLRCCTKAQPEMQDLAKRMLAKVNQIAPNIFKNAGPSCDTLGYCPEGNRCCGKAPTLQQLKDEYKKVSNK